jgi:uncharacterized YigZ family protein
VGKVKDAYYTLKGISEAYYKEKGSKFLAFAYPVDDEDAVKQRIEELRKKYYDARHHCYAYILGTSGQQYRANDDGEPGHSAGDPILGQLRSHELTNSLIVVVRYFGGTKLGISGLINAYKTASDAAIQNNRIITKLVLTEIKINFEYATMNQVMKMVKDFDLEIMDQRLELHCEMTLGVRQGLAEQVEQMLANTYGISIVSTDSGMDSR